MLLWKAKFFVGLGIDLGSPNSRNRVSLFCILEFQIVKILHVETCGPHIAELILQIYR